MITNEDIIASIEKHCRSHGIAESTFGKQSVNDGKLVARLRDGKSISLDTYNRIMSAMAPEAAE